MSEKKVLVPGSKLNISKELLEKGLPGLSKVKVGIGWDTNPSVGFDYDLDVTAVSTTEGDKSTLPEIVYYGNTSNPNGSITVSKDNRTGEGDGDDEFLTIDFTRVDPSIKEILIYVFIYNAEVTGQNFGQIDNAFVRVFDNDSDTELGKMDLSFDASLSTCVRFGKFMQKNGEWYFSSEKHEFNGGITEIAALHDVK